MKNWMLLLPVVLALQGCAQHKQADKAENKKDLVVGGPCEDCEAIYESPVSFDLLPNMVWLPDWNEQSTRLAINGVVYKPDGKTPAAGVIIYIYHTDQSGIYPRKGDEKGFAKQHGYLRGWMKTNEKGEYKFFTRRPGSYPAGKNPAHIHAVIKEPSKTAYWIDEYMFDDDPLLTPEERKKAEHRGGSGILKIPASYAGRPIVKSRRDIYLGRNIPGYK